MRNGVVRFDLKRRPTPASHWRIPDRYAGQHRCLHRPENSSRRHVAADSAKSANREV